MIFNNYPAEIHLNLFIVLNFSVDISTSSFEIGKSNFIFETYNFRIAKQI